MKLRGPEELAFDEEGGVGSIGLIAPGEGGVRLFEAEVGVLGEEFLDDDFIFVVIEAAGAVDELTAGFEERENGVGEVGLKFLHFSKDFGFEAPADVEAAAHDTGVAAWGVDEDAVELEVAEGWFGGLGPVVENGFGNGGVKALEVVAHALESLGAGVAGDDAALILHHLGDERGFSAGGGAGVEDEFAGLGIEQSAGVRGAGILGVALTGVEPGEGGIFGEVKAGDGRGFEVAGFNGFGVKLIEADEGGGGLLIPLTELFGVAGTELFDPAVDEPIGVGVTFVEGKGGELSEEGFAFAQGAAEDGVDEATGFAIGEIDGFVDGGVGGVVEKEDLGEAEPEKPVDAVFEVVVVAEFFEPVVEEGDVAEGAEDEGLEEGGVAVFEVMGAGVAVNEVGGKFFAVLPVHEDVEGEFAGVDEAWGFGVGVGGSGAGHRV